MINNLYAAREFASSAAQAFDEAADTTSERLAESCRRRGHENVQLAQAAALIAQAEAAERTALAAERQAEATEWIAGFLAMRFAIPKGAIVCWHCANTRPDDVTDCPICKARPADLPF